MFNSMKILIDKVTKPAPPSQALQPRIFATSVKKITMTTMMDGLGFNVKLVISGCIVIVLV